MATHRLDVFGHAVAIEADDPAAFDRLDRFLPPFAKAGAFDAIDVRYRVIRRRSVPHLLIVRGRRIVAALDDPAAVARRLAADLAVTISHRLRGRTLVHAGVVAIDGRAIVLPGRSGAGKSTLVRALIREGADYGSDEFAVVDARGRVRPWARWIEVRDRDGCVHHEDPRALGARVIADDVAVDLVVFTSFQPGAGRTLQPISAGRCAIGTIAHCLSARHRPAFVMSALGALSMSARAFHGPRGDATAFARKLLALARSTPRVARSA